MNELILKFNRLLYNFTKKYNVIKISTLDRGYHDKDIILLHSMMQVLVDYVEVELSVYYINCTSYNNLTPIEKVIHHLPSSLKFDFLVRNKERGVKVLNDWKKLYGVKAGSDRDDGQALIANRIEKIYTWWTQDRPKRKSPEELSGISNFVDNITDKHGDSFWELYFSNKLNNEQEKEINILSSKMKMIESQQDTEDRNMMEQVVSISPHLWT